ncbi:hypothetical protein IT398_02615 [Candidatus Nomurabacteria bacterium]|nr:hypothetical protein [Candidatus Nomurabacteria bacterium]
MEIFTNFDLLSVGITVAGILVLGFSVFFSDRKSVTNRAFLFFSLVTVLWSTINYSYYQIRDPYISFWLLRAVLFVATWHALSFFILSYVFPNKSVIWPKYLLPTLFSTSLFVSILTLTPLVFSNILTVSEIGRIVKIQNGQGIVVFGILISLFILGGLFNFIRKTIKARGIERKQNRLVLVGLIFTFALIFTFNFILPAFFDRPGFIPLGALFVFPFVAFVSYAIIKHGLLNIKVVTTEILTFILSVVTFVEVLFSDDLAQIIFRSGVFVLVLIFGILLIKSVRREVEQREKIEILAEELTIANERLKELDKQKTEFLSIASHQLRAPLTAIKGYSSLILEHSFGDIGEKVRGAVDIIFQSSQKLVTVIEDFLNITRIELGKMKYEMGPTDMKALVETAVKELGPQIEKRGLVLDVEIPAGLSFVVTADSGKIAQVIGNLIDNATKYTKEGSITIALSRPIGIGKVRLAITDTGVGLTPGAHAKLFEKFIRATDAGKINIIGTGLGLYVAKQIVEAHNGKIWAESPGPGKGSTFYVEL